jgi:hypothetical protein
MKTVVAPPSQSAGKPPSTVTITVLGAATTCPSVGKTTIIIPTTITVSATQNIVTSLTTLTVPGAGELTTVTVPTTVTLPGEEQVVTTLVPTTITVSGAATTCPSADKRTITVPTTLTLSATQNIVTSLTTLTIPGAGELTTVTVPTTVTLPGEEQVVTTMVPTTVTISGTCSPIITTQTISGIGSTVTVTESAPAVSATPIVNAACQSINPVVNGGFEGSLRSWNPLTADGGSITSSGNAARYVATSNTPQRLIQALSVCPGHRYAVAFGARRETAVAGTTGTATASLALDGVTYASFTVPVSENFVEINGNRVFTATTSSVSLVLQVTFTSASFGSGLAALIDNVYLTSFD